MKSIAVIGAGFSGAMTAVHLLSQKKIECQVILIDPIIEHARGVAYGVESTAFLLNVPAASMSAFADQPNHFMAWMQTEKLSYQADDFVPRKIYGDYIENILNQAAVASARLQKIHALVRSCEASAKSWIIYTDSGQQLTVDAIVLATGFPRQNFNGLNPHLNSSYDGIDKCNKIALIGSGLTAVDVLEQCRAGGYKGEYFLLSRSAKFPYVHQESGAEVDLSVASLYGRDSLSLAELLENLRSDIIKYGVSQVMHQLRPDILGIWQKLSSSDREKFFRHLESRWNRVRHRMPHSSAMNIDQLKQAGRLSFIKGRFERSQQQADLSYHITYNSKNAKNNFKVDRVFDCRGPSSSPQFNPLLRDLLDKGIIVLSELKRGVRTNAQGRATDINSPALYVVGPLRKEDLLESTAVRELRQQAFDVSAALLNELAATLEYSF